jgi:CHASE3 domain sensor protein
MNNDIYRAAYEEANAELNAVFEQFEQLRRRKAQIEGVVEVLKPLLELQAHSVPGVA